MPVVLTSSVEGVAIANLRSSVSMDRMMPGENNVRIAETECMAQHGPGPETVEAETPRWHLLDASSTWGSTRGNLKSSDPLILQPY